MTPAVLLPTPILPKTYGNDATIARFSVSRYQRMIEAGILDANDHVELLEGFVVLKMPRNPRHDATIQRMQRLLFKVIPAGWDFRCQSALSLADSQPEPDFAIVRGSPADFDARHPDMQETTLVIEVADSTLLRDRHDKARIYARAGIAHYWIVNLVNRQLERFWEPSGPTDTPSYAFSEILTETATVPLILDGIAIAEIQIAELLV